MPAKKKATDPWFDKPYEASNQIQAANARPASTRKTAVAALLGGLVSNK